VVYDYLALVLAALAARGQSYQAVATVQNTDVEAPRHIPGGQEDIRMTDRNVILARTDLPATVFAVGQVQTGHFATQAPNPVPQIGSLRQGWASVEVSLHGRALRVVNTHLTPAQDTIQEAQGSELLAGPLNTALPTVLLGDLNSAAGGTGAIPGHTLTATYANLLEAGFTDAAVTASGQGRDQHAGFTCCQDADLRNATSHLSQRLDYVLLRNGLSASSANRVGADPADRTPSGLWPSDHAGVWAVLHLQDA
jgi:endonuclease/exonuclease/phosphatase (EEP) superfamily protein YafD